VESVELEASGVAAVAPAIASSSDNIPAAQYQPDGGRIRFGSMGMLYAGYR